MVPSGHHLMVRKAVPFGALFWYPQFAKRHQLKLKWCCYGAFFTKKDTIFQNGSQQALFWLHLFSQCMTSNSNSSKITADYSIVTLSIT